MSGGDQDDRSEACVSFLVAGANAPAPLEPLETVLNEMPPFVHLGVMRNGHFAIRLGKE